jgi:hypothetical protein
MTRPVRYGLCFASILLLALLIVANRKHGFDFTSPARTIDAWDIQELADYLNRGGVEVRIQTVSRHGPLGSAAYLTTTVREWKDLNSLRKDSQHIHEWSGTLYCERVTENEREQLYLFEQWREYSLVKGPFIFYGDPELLVLVRDALASIEVPTTP